MATEGEPPRGGHELDFGAGAHAAVPPTASAAAAPPAPAEVAPIVAPVDPAAPVGAQPAGAQPAAAQPAQAYPPAGYQAQPYPPSEQVYPQYQAQPYGAQPGQPYPGPGYVAPPVKKSSKGLLWGLIGGGAAVLIAVVLVVALLVVPALTRSSVTAADTVKAYLTAISKGDAKAALGYLESVPSADLLTDSVLKESNKIAKISGISVHQGTQSSYSGSVTATYSIGGEEVSSTYQVYKVKDAWRIADGVIPVSLDSLKGLDATINGVSAAKLPDVYVFPGSYRIALSSAYFSLDGDSTFTIASLDDASALYDVNAALNDTGAAEFRKLVRASVEACVAMKTLSTPCGMDITGINLAGATPVEGTVTRTLTADGNAALNELKPESSGFTPTVVSAYDTIRVDITLQGSDGNTYTVTSGGYLDTPRVDFATATPAVVWE